MTSIRKMITRFLVAGALVVVGFAGTSEASTITILPGSQTIGAGGTATITNVSTGQFPASTAGNADINARVKLPQPCIAPIVFVFGAPNGCWFAVTGS